MNPNVSRRNLFIFLCVLIGPASAPLPKEAVGALLKDDQSPASADLTPQFSKAGITARAQGSRDTCSLFAITALANYEQAVANPRTHEPLSEEFLTWAANEATGLSGDQAMFYEAIHGLNTFGICSAKQMPYEASMNTARRPSSEARADAKERSQRWKTHWIRRWSVDAPATKAELLAIKTALANGHPVACGLRWPKALSSASILEVPASKDVRDGHSIVFIGYEDDDSKPGGGVFRFRNSVGSTWGDKGDGWMSYAYFNAYANDALWLELGAPGAESPLERFEAESAPIRAQQKCKPSRQRMDNWAKAMWSRGEQLFCGAQKDGLVELGFTVRTSGRYRVRVLATAAPDFGVIRATLDGKKLALEFDLYSGRVCPAGSLELGNHELSAGEHSLSFTAIGKHGTSKNHSFGLDAIDLLPPWSSLAAKQK